MSLLARPENNTTAMFQPTAEELETKKKEKERRDRRAERRRLWLEEQAAKGQAHGASESTEVDPAETSRAARRRLRDERREAAQAQESSSSSSSSDDESPAPAQNMDTEDVIANDSCMFAACDIDAGQESDQAPASPTTDGAGSSAESEGHPGPYICLFCGEEFPSEAAEDYHVMRECQNKE